MATYGERNYKIGLCKSYFNIGTLARIVTDSLLSCCPIVECDIFAQSISVLILTAALCFSDLLWMLVSV